ncbi:hypothetical protein [Ancylobacter sp. G4_0304]|uniref:hypothetical protein n=1 Tax=Ancylobacter sp. G4_0304 TaxID=3114289 RepID=UPI0039C746B4
MDNFRQWLKSIHIRSVIERAAGIAATVGIVVSAGFLIGVLFPAVHSDRRNLEIMSLVEYINGRIDSTGTSISEISSKVDYIIKSLTEIPDNDKIAISITQLAMRVELVENNLKDIKSIISQNPEDALNVVLLKKDLQFLRERAQEKIEEQNDKIDKIYNIFGWSLGGLLVAVLAQAIAGFVRRRPT